MVFVVSYLNLRVHAAVLDELEAGLCVFGSTVYIFCTWVSVLVGKAVHVCSVIACCNRS